MARELNVIAEEISKDWKNVSITAAPYLEAMKTLSSIDDTYWFDTGRDVVLRFLSNAATWRGETARRIKKELKAMF